MGRLDNLSSDIGVVGRLGSSPLDIGALRVVGD